MAEADDCVVWIQAHDWQTALSRLELRHHLSDADVQPTQESTLALLKKQFDETIYPSFSRWCILKHKNKEEMLKQNEQKQKLIKKRK